MRRIVPPFFRSLELRNDTINIRSFLVELPMGNLYPPSMVIATSNPARQLLYVSYIARVQTDDLKQSHEDVKALLAGLKPGFRLLVDLTRLESMGLECAAEIGNLMDLIDQSGVSLVVRVIPDSKKDIGMNILTLFHYRHRPRLVTCAKLTEAAQELSL